MKLIPTPVPGAWLIDEEIHEDTRGYFLRTYCRRELSGNGIVFEAVQSSISLNRARGTMRGMHFQAAPHQEMKLVTCLRGSIYDVILDLRSDSTACGRWFAAELTAGTGRSLLVPKGCAHGFQTLEDDTVVVYHISQYYHPAAARGVRWNDPRFGIAWPLPIGIISERDRSYPDFSAVP